MSSYVLCVYVAQCVFCMCMCMFIFYLHLHVYLFSYMYINIHTWINLSIHLYHYPHLFSVLIYLKLYNCTLVLNTQSLLQLLNYSRCSAHEKLHFNVPRKPSTSQNTDW